MIAVEVRAIERLLLGEPPSHRSIALRHAAIHHRPGLQGDHPSHPTSLVWLRPGDPGIWEAFAAGDPAPALDSIEQSGISEVALLAPGSWEPAVRRRGGRIVVGTILTSVGVDRRDRLAPRLQSRSLTIEDGPAFLAEAPAWALRSWSGYGDLIEHGLAVGLATAEGFAAIAWTYESDHDHDKIGVATAPRHRRLGLGQAVTSALLDRIVADRRKVPVWVTTTENAASVALARSLGFADPTPESLLRWTPDRG
jgi:GNAT superfamily N-acetyltransferase